MSIEDLIYPLLKAYTAAPQWVKSSIGRGYALLPAVMRYGPEFRRFRAELSILDPEKIRAVKREKLRHTLQWALETVPTYAPYRHLLQQEDDPYAVLAKLPLVGKLDIKKNLERYVSTAMSTDRKLPMFTGGSTAHPMKFYLHRGVTRSREFAYTNDFNGRTGIRDGDRILAMRGRSVPGADKPGGRLWMYEPIKNQLVLSSDHLLAQYMPSYVEAMRQWKPTAIQAFPSALYPLAKWLETHPATDITERIRCIHLTSENVYEYQMQLLRRVFRCRVVRHYGHSERVLFGATLSDDDSYLFWPLYGHLELVDSQGNAITKPGVLGEIVGTSFDNQIMPFVRYRTGDMGVWAAKEKAGFEGWQRLERIEGRLQEFVVCRDGRLISICTLGAAHFEDLAQAEAIQYAQFAPGILIVRIQSGSTLSDAARARVKKAVRDKTQGGCEVHVECVERIHRTERGKMKMLEQHLDISTYFDNALAIGVA